MASRSTRSRVRFRRMARKRTTFKRRGRRSRNAKRHFRGKFRRGRIGHNRRQRRSNRITTTTNLETNRSIPLINNGAVPIRILIRLPFAATTQAEVGTRDSIANWMGTGDYQKWFGFFSAGPPETIRGASASHYRLNWVRASYAPTINNVTNVPEDVTVTGQLSHSDDGLRHTIYPYFEKDALNTAAMLDTATANQNSFKEISMDRRSSKTLKTFWKNTGETRGQMLPMYGMIDPTNQQPENPFTINLPYTLQWSEDVMNLWMLNTGWGAQATPAGRAIRQIPPIRWYKSINQPTFMVHLPAHTQCRWNLQAIRKTNWTFLMKKDLDQYTSST